VAWTGPIENEEFANPSGAGTTYTFSPNATIPVGTLIVLGWMGSVTDATLATCADNSSQAGSANTYTALATQSTSGPSDQGGLIWCVTTRSILATDVVTITAASSSRRNGRMVTFTGQAASPFDTSANQAAVTSQPYAIGPTATLAETNELVIGASFVASAAPPVGFSDSTTGYTAIVGAGSGGTGTPVVVCMSYKTTAGTAAETDTHAYSGTWSKAMGQIMAFKQAAASTATSKPPTRVRRVWSGR
jgi:hypothetical protein